jgi:hypothetical protein
VDGLKKDIRSLDVARNDGLLKDIRENLRNAINSEDLIRESALRSSQFIDGDQWREEDKSLRDEEGRPYYTFNKLRKVIKQLSGDIRQNMPSLKVIPVQNAGYEESQVMNEMIRYIERNSNAEDAYRVAAEQQLDGGYGFWLIDFEDSTFEPNAKEIKIRRISNRFTVYLDHKSNTYTYEDARWGFITELIPKKEFKEQYPNAVMQGVDSTVGDYDLDWYEEEHVRVAVYYYKVKKKVTIVKIFNPFNGELYNTELTEEFTQNSIKRAGLILVDSEEKELDKVMWCKASGEEILEEPQPFPCEYIPIVPVFGYEQNNQGRRIYRAVTYDAEAAQEAYNYTTTKAIERISLAPLAPYIGTDVQIKGKEEMWTNANRRNYAVLTYNNDPLASGPPKRNFPEPVSPALIQQAAISDNDINDIIGRGLASFGLANKERTGAAIEAQKRSSDVTTYTFFSNFLMSMQYSGRILLSMIPQIYDNERVIRIFGDDNQLQEMHINKVVRDLNTGEEIIINDLSKGKYDYIPVSTIGQLTKRLEMKQALIDVMTIAPEFRPAFVEAYVDVSDIPNKNEVLETIRTIKQQQAAAAANEQQQRQRGSSPQPRQAIVQ